MRDITIIGGGLGGLVSGALLAKEGYHITLLEQHTLAGGCATTFGRKGGYHCEVGLHEMDGVYSSVSIRDVFEKLDIYSHMEFVKPREFYRHIGGDIDFVMPNNIKDAIAKLKAHYPKESTAIDRYFALIKKIHDLIEQIQNLKWWEMALFPWVFRTLLYYRKHSVKDIMDKLFIDEKLKMLLNTNVQYYHNSIQELSFILHSIAQHSFFNGGGYFIKGGSQVLSDYLVSIIESHGGKVLLGAEVTSISIDDNKATAITYSMRNQADKTISTDILISNLSPAQTYAMAKVEYKEHRDISISLLSVYIGFKHDLKSIYGSKPYTTFFLKDVDTIEAYDSDRGSIEERGFVFTDYSQIDSGLTPEGKSFGVICSVDSLSEWEGMDRKQYRAKKSAISSSYIKELSREYPDIENHIEFVEVGTAKTMQRYLKTPNGAAYGFAPTTKQFFHTPQTKSNKIDNIYFVGAWVISGGFSAAIISAKMCYEKIYSEYINKS